MRSTIRNTALCCKLDVAKRLSEVCCENFTSEQQCAIPIIYSMMRSCNRSQPHLELLKVALQVLRNVCAYTHLTPAVAQPAE